MSAITTDKLVELRYSNTETYPVTAATKIPEGAFVSIPGATGNAVNATNASDDVFKGIAAAQADNTSGAAGDIRVTVIIKGRAKVVGSGLASTDVGKMAYVSDNQTITTTPGYVPCGVIVQVDSATVAWIDLDSAVLARAAVL